jgi:hypothetical protein
LRSSDFGVLANPANHYRSAINLGFSLKTVKPQKPAKLRLQLKLFSPSWIGRSRVLAAVFQRFRESGFEVDPPK